MTTSIIILSILSGIIAGEVLYRVCDDESLGTIVMWTLMLVMGSALIYKLVWDANNSTLVLHVASVTSLSMAAYIGLRVLLYYLINGFNDEL